MDPFSSKTGNICTGLPSGAVPTAAKTQSEAVAPESPEAETSVKNRKDMSFEGTAHARLRCEVLRTLYPELLVSVPAKNNACTAQVAGHRRVIALCHHPELGHSG